MSQGAHKHKLASSVGRASSAADDIAMTSSCLIGRSSTSLNCQQQQYFVLPSGHVGSAAPVCFDIFRSGSPSL